MQNSSAEVELELWRVDSLDWSFPELPVDETGSAPASVDNVSSSETTGYSGTPGHTPLYEEFIRSEPIVKPVPGAGKLDTVDIVSDGDAEDTTPDEVLWRRRFTL